MSSTKKIGKLVDEAVGLLPQIIRFVTRDDRYQSKDLELSISQLRFLRVLQEQGEMGMRGLSDALSVAPPSATITADRLVEQSLVVRREDRKDRRVVRVALTPNGKALMNKFLNAKKKRWREFLASLDETDRRVLIRTLRNLLMLLEKSEHGTPKPSR